ncbi:MAG TPA: hypothetical protein VFR87_02915 [Nocardioidaceae bacterium]|nr:hypothetical protein [Nocardioidaceae bacterium]
MTAAIGVLILIVVLWAVVSVVGTFNASRSLDVRERDELDRLRLLVDDLKETAWDHRELDSALATIFIDKIRAHERRGRPELGG